MWSIVGLKRAFIASGLILSIPWEDHFTKSTLQKDKESNCLKKPTLVLRNFLEDRDKVNRGNTVQVKNYLELFVGNVKRWIYIPFGKKTENDPY